ncbi:DUF5989 family protein [Synoicihabitans lomoniglobus]|uniref:DUF5989 family protein n=1 Tax=Synoicihabitans lomoniglobus TaxID=2909285 RepID=A0AAF0CR48_9BACT|nr:DUF5989 family protein [Opitutaceae bacterium LMO-M01]WED66549.1 DUF5989 family protein [Opitutaceae bacterium LMO-M01]
MSKPDPSFEEASQQPQKGVIAEFWDFVIHNKKWWLTPIIIVLLLVSALVVLGGSGAAPFIYSLF